MAYILARRPKKVSELITVISNTKVGAVKITRMMRERKVIIADC